VSAAYPSSVPSPPMAEHLTPRVVTWATGRQLWRCHSSNRGGDEFNPCLGKARFSPLYDAHGNCVPTAYFGERIRGALAEAVFHDVPRAVPPGGVRVLTTADQSDLCLTRVVTRSQLRLVELHGLGLRRLGLRAEEISGTEPVDYARTVLWAECVHAWRDDDGLAADGLVWRSRQIEDFLVLIVFGDRWPSENLFAETPQSVTATPEVWRHVTYMAHELNVQVI
jgi:RES domain